MDATFDEPQEWWVDGTPDSVEAIFRRTAEDLRRPGFAYSVDNSRHRSGVPTLTVRVSHANAGGGPVGHVQVVGLPGDRTSVRVPKGRGSLNPQAWDTDPDGTMFAAYIESVIAELGRSGFTPKTPTDASQPAVPFEAMWPYVAQGLDRLERNHPEVHAKIDLAHRRLQEVSSSEDCQTVGLLCRDALILLANELFSPDFVPAGADAPAYDKVVQRVELTLQHFGAMAGTDSLRALVRSVVKFAMRVHHDQAATVTDATRSVLYTTLAVVEVAALMEEVGAPNHLVQEWGVYKCQACGSTDLNEDLDVDVDSDGIQSPTFFLSCSKCNWGLVKGLRGEPMRR